MGLARGALISIPPIIGRSRFSLASCQIFPLSFLAVRVTMLFLRQRGLSAEVNPVASTFAADEMSGPWLK